MRELKPRSADGIANTHTSERLRVLGSSFIKELEIRVPRKGYSGFRVKGPRFGV